MPDSINPASSVADSLRNLASPALDPLFWPNISAGVDSAWTPHVPFGHWIVTAHKPRMVVELGTHNGTSFLSFCEAVQRNKYDCQCIAVDTWTGDEHAGFYGDSVFEELRKLHDARYSGFSELLRTTFDQALPYVADESVDLLHIDGLHTYDAVKHDFDSWLPKLTSRGVVLFHDINVRERDFGVWRLWAELRSRYPGFEFHHGHGLGVLMVGAQVSSDVAFLHDLPPEAASAVRERFAFLGERWRAEMRLALATGHAARAGDKAALVEAQAHAALLQQEMERLGRDAAGYKEQALGAEARLRDAMAELKKSGPELARVRAEARAVAMNEAHGAAEAHARQMIVTATAHHEGALAKLRDEMDAVREEAADMRRASQAACAQRDMARLSLRRVAASADHAWRSRLALEAAHGREAVESALRRAGEIDAQLQAVERARESAAQDALYWNARYNGLRARLEGLLRRFGVMQMARLFPRPVRRVVRERVLGR